MPARWQYALGSLVVSSLFFTSAHAGPTSTLGQVGEGVGCVGVAGVSALGLLADGVIFATVGVELVGAVGYGVLTQGDPPDTVNYAVQANEPLLIPSVPTEPGEPTAYYSAETNYITAASAFIQTGKDIFDTVDRLAGAKLVGTSMDVANQQKWLSQFATQAVAQYQHSQLLLQAYAAQLAADYPTIDNTAPTEAQVVAVATAEAAGNFPAEEQSLITAWQLTPDEVGFCETCFANAINTLKNQANPLTLADDLTLVDTIHDVPEPGTLALLAGPLAALLFLGQAMRRRGGKTRRSGGTWAAITAAMLLAAGLLRPQPSHAQELKTTTIKDITVKNPSGNADKVVVSHNLDVVRTQGKAGTVFAKDAINGGTVTFTGGTLNSGAQSTYAVHFNGAILPPPPVASVVSRIQFYDGNTLLKTIENTTGIKNPDAIQKAQAQEFAQNVTGFTYEEYYDLSNLADGLLHIGNSNAALDLTYTIDNLNVYTNLPLSNYTLSTFDDPGTATPIYSASSVTLDPGQSFDLPLGSILPNGYELATATEITVAVAGGSTADFVAPQGFAESLQFVPEPASAAPLAVSLLMLIGLRLATGRRRGTGDA